jgi:hypothetical protein
VISNQDIIDLTRPGSTAGPESAADIAPKLNRYGIDSNDIVIVNMLSNSYVRGTDNEGNLIQPYKDSDTGKWHVPGHLSFTPKPAFKKILGLGSEN